MGNQVAHHQGTGAQAVVESDEGARGRYGVGVHCSRSVGQSL